CVFFFFFSSRRRHTRFSRDWSSDVCSSDLVRLVSRAVQRIDEDGVWSEDEHVPADVILLGTGFRASEFLMPMRVTGVDGVDLHEIGRASCRERVWSSGGAGPLKTETGREAA